MLNKAAIQVGGGSLQVYQKDGNNLHTEFVEEWIILEEQALVKNTNYFWKLSERSFNVRLVSLWAKTTGNITLKLTRSNAEIIATTITSAQANNGYQFPFLIVSEKFDINILPLEAVDKLFITAKEISVCENLSFSR